MENAQANDRFRALLKLLLERSRQSVVTWKQENDMCFVARFPPQSSVQSGFCSPSSDPDFYYATLTRGPSQIFEMKASEGDGDWSLLRALYAEAERAGINWEGALADVEQILNAGGNAEPSEAKR